MPKGKLVIPVVFLSNAYQAQHVIIEVPQQNEQPEVAEVLTEEEKQLLEKFNFKETEPDPSNECVIPAFVSHETIDAAMSILEVQDPVERRFKLYALFQTAPQLFTAINDYLPEELRLRPETDFQNTHEVYVESYDAYGTVTAKQEKMLQLAPQYIKDHPSEIKESAFDCLTTDQLFEKDDQSVLNELFGFSPSETTIVATKSRQLKNTTAVIQPKGQTISQFSFISDEDKADLQAHYKQKSQFAERFKDQVKQRFLNLINTKYKQLHAQELIEILQTIDQRKPSPEQLDIAVTFLYFDKLDIIHSFQLMQQVNNTNLTPIRNQQFGWPTMYPVKNIDQTIQQIIQQTERRYQDQRVKTSQLQDIYQKIFLMNKRHFENQLPKPQMLPKIVERIRYYADKDIQMVELHVIDQGVQGLIQIPRQLYEEGQSEKSPSHKQYVEVVHAAVNQLKISKQQQLLQKKPRKENIQIQNIQNNIQNSINAQQTQIVQQIEDDEPEYTSKKWKRTSQRRVNIKTKMNEHDLTVKLIQAGKLNTITLFDLDSFFELCIALCNSDIDYPPFYFEDLQSRTTYGQQISIIKAPRQIYSILLRFNFCNYDYLKRVKFMEPLLKLYRLATSVPSEALKDTVSPHKLLEKDYKEQELNEVAKDEPATPEADLQLPSIGVSQDLFQQIISGTISFTDAVRECVDKCNMNFIRVKDKKLLECDASDKHCTCHFQGKPCDGSCNGNLDTALIEVQNDMYPCPSIFDYSKKQLKPGFVLQSAFDLYEDEQDDPQSFTFITAIKEFKFKDQDQIDECFYPFFNYSTFYNFKRMNYCVQLLQFIEFYFNANPNQIELQQKMDIDHLCSDYYSCRLDGLVLQSNESENYWDKYQIIQKLQQRTNQPPKNVTIKHIERLQKPYDYMNTASDIFKNSVISLDFKVQPSHYFFVKSLSSFFNKHSLSQTTTSVLNHNLRCPEVIQEMLNEPTAEKEPFVYPIPENQEIEAEVDLSVLKKDSVLNKLKTFGQSYKQMPEEMLSLLKKQHQELFDIGAFRQDPYRTPTTFQETKQMANSVLNHGLYFTIPFGSEANRHVEVIETDEYIDEQNDFTSLMEKNRSGSQQVKSQYIKWAGPTGAEAQVCHIEEEQLCFGLFKVRANNLMKILIEWMTIYTPSMLKFFDCSITTTAMDANPDLGPHYIYRAKMEEQQSAKNKSKINPYFFNGEYKMAIDELEPEEQEIDPDAPELFKAFSTLFDNAILDLNLIYNQFSKMTQSDDVLNKAKVDQIQDAWVKGCYAPIQQWPFNGQQFALPPPPHIPALLQTFLTQMYTTGDILDEIYKNPIIAIPIIARTLQHHVAASKHGEQRAAAVWRTLYPDAYYRSIDHANVCLQVYDKKYMQPKQLLQDLQRRITDCEQANNPQQLDSAIDFCLPRVFDAVNFMKYSARMQTQPTPKQLSNYFDRLAVQQSFYPASKILMPFRFNCNQLSNSMTKLCEQMFIGQDWKEVSTNNFKKILNNIFTSDNNNYNNDMSKDMLEKVKHDDLYDRLFQVYPGVNWSLLFNQQTMVEFMEAQNAQIQSKTPQNVKNDEPQPNEDDVIYMEELIYDLCNSDKIQPEYSLNLYNEDIQNQLSEMMRMLKYDNAEIQKYLRLKLDQCMTQNKFLPSLFINNNKSMRKQATQIYTKNRNMSIPSVTNRSLYMLRAVFFNEQIEESLLIRLINNEINNEEIQQIIRTKTNDAKTKLIKAILNCPSASQQKAAAQTHLPGLQSDLCKKQIFDEFLIPVMQDIGQDQTRIRYIDQELYQIIRFLAIACYRLEYCLKTMEELPPHLRQAAVYGTRSIYPIPLSYINQLNLGMSVFGNNLIENFENYQQKALPKNQSDNIPLLVSQRVLNGHQPYGNLLNTVDSSLNGCVCCCIICPFCGGIGAGLNGTLSGNLNLRVAQGQAAEMEINLVNGIYKAQENQFKWEDIVFMNTWNQPERKIEDVPSFYEQGMLISLLYKLQPTIPQYEAETSNYIPMEDNTQQVSKKNKNKTSNKTSTAETVDDEIPLAQKIKMLSKEEPDSFYVPSYGCRLQDTTLMLPPPDIATMNYYLAKYKDNKFVRDYLEMSHYQKIVSQVATKEQHDNLQDIYNLPEQLVFEDPAQAFIINREMAAKYFNNDLNSFLNRNFIVPSEDLSLKFSERNPTLFKKHISLLMELLMKMQPTAKDDYINDQVYGLLGTHGYPFLSLKKLIVNVHKRLETLSSKMLSQHYDLVNLQYYKSGKCTIVNNLTTSLLMFGIWQNFQISAVQDVLPVNFGQSLINLMKDLREGVYLVENYQGFMNIQNIYFETEKKFK
ncbi:Conserved_hypothetical protein [Hexamita inflata]|uniref:Uncharacterized protein n=1 Tax=Hexamita inflata TaxID=28002 RepID=A0AA86UNJ6_9EUKA|nr:Conserved hypothetical protein [Hexamita inflata]